MKTITLSGTPIAKARPRGTKTKTGKILFYTPKKSKDFEGLVRQRGEQVFDKPMDVPIKMSVLFLMPRPVRLIWKTKPMTRIPCDRMPDLDNLVKSIEDALNGVAYFDDKQITTLTARKMYHSGDESPKTTITIQEDVYD